MQKVKLLIKDYKTEKSFGDKELEINNSKFLQELKSLKLKDNDYLITMKNGDKVKNIITWNDKIKKLTIGNLALKCASVRVDVFAFRSISHFSRMVNIPNLTSATGRMKVKGSKLFLLWSSNKI